MTTDFMNLRVISRRHSTVSNGRRARYPDPVEQRKRTAAADPQSRTTQRETKRKIFRVLICRSHLLQRFAFPISSRLMATCTTCGFEFGRCCVPGYTNAHVATGSELYLSYLGSLLSYGLNEEPLELLPQTFHAQNFKTFFKYITVSEKRMQPTNFNTVLQLYDKLAASCNIEPLPSNLTLQNWASTIRI